MHVQQEARQIWGTNANLLPFQQCQTYYRCQEVVILRDAVLAVRDYLVRAQMLESMGAAPQLQKVESQMLQVETQRSLQLKLMWSLRAVAEQVLADQHWKKRKHLWGPPLVWKMEVRYQKRRAKCDKDALLHLAITINKQLLNTLLSRNYLSKKSKSLKPDQKQI